MVYREFYNIEKLKRNKLITCGDSGSFDDPLSHRFNKMFDFFAFEFVLNFPFLNFFLNSLSKTLQVLNKFLNIIFVNIFYLFNKLFVLTVNVLPVQNFFDVVYKKPFYIFFRNFNNWRSFVR